jgi:hypothetical protein
MTDQDPTVTLTSRGRVRAHVVAEHEALARLEQASTQMRHQTFTALMSISFVLAGFAFKSPDKIEPACITSGVDKCQELLSNIVIKGVGTYRPNQIAAVLGLVFYAFTVLHYWWYHRYSHIYRHQLKELEGELGIQVYSHRQRPTASLGKRTMKFHFDWSLYIIGVLYTSAVVLFSGWRLVVVPFAISLVLYGFGLLKSTRDPEEPRETHAAMSQV